ncbi:penicillin acylase family protein [Sphingobium sp. AN558]|uniref:penicillin acylase family protein n=1 Tax=Sphingobium sp. AN558 TaxID=3133442 RepID=UPI0030BC71BB
MRIWLAALAASTVKTASIAASSGAKYGGGEIMWDSFGVPHIYAKTQEGGFYGYAQAQSHGNLLLRI